MAMEELLASNFGPPAYVRFINKTNRRVGLYWINFEGVYISYVTLEKKDDFVDINTYKNHPWLAIDYHTKDKLLLNSNSVHLPKTPAEIVAEKLGRPVPQHSVRDKIRAKVTIQNPLCTLKRLALLTLKTYIMFPRDVDKLMLPRELVSNLKALVTQRNEEFLYFGINNDEEEENRSAQNEEEEKSGDVQYN